MIEVQIHRLCSQPEPKIWLGIGPFQCPECHSWAEHGPNMQHKSVIEWVPLEKAIQMAHEESANKAHRHEILKQMAKSELEAGLYGVIPDDFASQ